MDTSSAETGSSATTMRGPTAMARAMPMRWRWPPEKDRKSTRLNSSHANISYAVFCLKKKKQEHIAKNKLANHFFDPSRSENKEVHAAQTETMKKMAAHSDTEQI